MTWKLPAWLDARLPRLNIEGSSPADLAQPAIDERVPAPVGLADALNARYLAICCPPDRGGTIVSLEESYTNSFKTEPPENEEQP